MEWPKTRRVSLLYRTQKAFSSVSVLAPVNTDTLGLFGGCGRIQRAGLGFLLGFLLRRFGSSEQLNAFGVGAVRK